MRTLYEIEGDWLKVADMLEESGGEITPEIEELTGSMMDGLEDETDRKLENYCKFFRSEESLVAAMKEEHERLWLRIERKRRAIDFLKSKVFAFIKRFRPDGLQAGIFHLKIQKNGGSQKLELTCEPQQLPDAYREVNVSFSANRKRIIEDIESGKELPFAKLLPRGERLVIK